MNISNKFKLLLTLITASLTASASLWAETIETVEYKTYTISPRAPQEIKPELMRRTPIRERGGSYNGHTDWYVDWHYQSRQMRNTCLLQNIQTKVHVVYTLPELSSYVTDPQTIAVFNKFNSALTQHEKNHGKNGILAAREIDTALKNIETQRNCRYLSRRQINDIANNIIRKYTQADREYDRRTDNGRTEGALILLSKGG